jgi:predicted RNA-binding protein with PUA-like domain
MMEVVSKAYPDALQFDPESKYFDEKSSEAEPRWINVDMEFVEKFTNPITRDQLKEKESLASMELFRLGRYSITQVSKEEWDTIVTLKNGS